MALLSNAILVDGVSMLIRHRPWLVLASLIALSSCDLNPQPVLPADRAVASPSGAGGTSSGTSAQEPGTETSGAGDAGGASGVGTPNAGGMGGEAGAGADGGTALTGGAGGEPSQADAGAGGTVP